LSGELVQRDADAAARASEVRARARATDADNQAQAQFQQNLAHTTAELSSLRQFVNQLQNEKDMLLEQKNSRERIVVSLSSQKAPSGAVVGDG
jgi:TolA-binding protein